MQPDLIMISALILFHIVISALLIGAVLIQKNDADALGGLGGGGGMSMGGVISTRASKTFLSRVTTTLAIVFFATSLALAILSHRGDAGQDSGNSIANEILKQNTLTPGQTPVPQAPASAPEVPLAK